MTSPRSVKPSQCTTSIRCNPPLQSRRPQRRGGTAPVLPGSWDRRGRLQPVDERAPGWSDGRGDQVQRHRLARPDERFYGEGLHQNLTVAQRVKTVAAGLGCSQAQLAVAWTLANPAVTSAIVGFPNGEEAADLLKGMPGPLEPATMAALRADQV